ncbi:MAG: glycosyltransferase family 39 protein [Acidobacteria bacterium]|nr:glycosyltransferase family 39 protein [Acidobacteriota bacterium]
MKEAVPWKLVLAIMALAFILRIAWIVSQTAVIENEGGEYARIAENLLRGNGYVGTQGWPQLTYGPLFPWLIAASTLLTRNSEVAGRCVVLIFGTLLVLPVYLVCLHIHGRRTALIAGFMVALHPLLIGYSGAVYNEAIFLTVLLVGIYWGLRCLELESSKHGLFAGMCFGLAYLSRVEALIYPLLTSLATLLTCFLLKRKLKRALRTCALLLTAFLALAAPYVVYLSSHIGKLRFEAKGKINYTIGRRIQAGMTVSESQQGIRRDLTEEGPLLDEHRFFDFSPYPMGPRDIVNYIFAAAHRNKAKIWQRILADFPIGSPVLLGLVLIGLFGRPWDKCRFVSETYLLIVVGCILSILLIAHFVQFRYGLPLVPFLILWAARGVEELSGWAVGTAANLGRAQGGIGSRIARVVPPVIVSMLVWVAGIGVFHYRVGELDNGGKQNLPLKQAGLWLRSYMPGPKKIMLRGTCVPYYADAVMVYLPEAEDADVTLRYIDHKAPDFILLSDLDSPEYLHSWLSKGMPDSRAQLVYEKGTEPQKDRVRIYRWIPAHSS